MPTAASPTDAHARRAAASSVSRSEAGYFRANEMAAVSPDCSENLLSAGVATSGGVYMEPCPRAGAQASDPEGKRSGAWQSPRDRFF